MLNFFSVKEEQVKDSFYYRANISFPILGISNLASPVSCTKLKSSGKITFMPEITNCYIRGKLLRLKKLLVSAGGVAETVNIGRTGLKAECGAHILKR